MNVQIIEDSDRDVINAQLFSDLKSKGNATVYGLRLTKKIENKEICIYLFTETGELICSLTINDEEDYTYKNMGNAIMHEIQEYLGLKTLILLSLNKRIIKKANGKIGMKALNHIASAYVRMGGFFPLKDNEFELIFLNTYCYLKDKGKTAMDMIFFHEDEGYQLYELLQESLSNNEGEY